LALLGDIAIAAFPLVHPHIAEIMPIVITQILTEPSDTQVSVCNNATWAVGEIALQFAQDGQCFVIAMSLQHNADFVSKSATQFQPFIAPVMERLVPILCNTRSPRSLSENAAVTIGRMGLICPEPIAPHLSHFAKAW
jgi:transportin-1